MMTMHITQLRLELCYKVLNKCLVNMKKYVEALKQYAKDATTSDAKTGACWEGYERVPNTKKGEPGSCRKIGSSKADYK